MYNINVVLILTLLSLTLIISVPFIIINLIDNKSSSIKLSNCNILHELEFGGVFIKISIDEFNKLGFSFGDSVNIYFSNGYKLRNIPYYNGYYTNTGEPLLIGYPGYEYIKVAISNGDDLWNVAELNINNIYCEGQNMLWDIFNLSEDLTVTISLNKKGKFLDIQNARDIHYLVDREKYASDEVFANFRCMKGGKLKKNYFYRSASPCDNQYNRANYVDALIKNVGIKYIINLADNDYKIQSYISKETFNSPYFLSLYNKNSEGNKCVIPLALNMNYTSKYFISQTIKALIAISEHEGPFLIHCTEGKDRTGFVCLLIEALAGATYEEILKDYMLTYTNYYSVTKNFDENKFNIIVENVLNPMIQSITNKKSVDIKKANLKEYAKKFVIKNGLTLSQFEKLEQVLTNN